MSKVFRTSVFRTSRAAQVGYCGDSTGYLCDACKSKLRVSKGVMRAAADLSDVELRNVLHGMLYATEPAFGDIVAVYRDTSTVFYYCKPDGVAHLWERTFTLSGPTVKLNDDKAEVKETTTYEPVQNATANERKSIVCDCNCLDCRTGKCPHGSSISSLPDTWGLEAAAAKRRETADINNPYGIKPQPAHNSSELPDTWGLINRDGRSR